MGLKQRLTLACALLAVISAGLLAHDLWQWRRIARYNLAIGDARYAQAAELGGERGVFAQACAAQRDGEYQAARVLYSQLEKSPDAALRAAVLFNTGNTYLEQAASLDPVQEADRAIPLLELAKASFRQLLHESPQDWDARYNLERALRLLPDAHDKPVTEVEGRQSPVRTVIAGDAEENWP